MSDDELGRQLNIGLLVLTMAFGLGLIATALVGNQVWEWPDIWSAVLIELGGAVGLVGFFFVLERLFLQQVRGEREASERRLQAKADDLERRLGARLDSLEREARIRTETRYKAQDQAVRALTEDISRDTVMQALDHAERLDAIAGSFRVGGSYDLDGMRLEFSVTSSADSFDYRSPDLELSLIPWFPGRGRIPGELYGHEAGYQLIRWEHGEPVDLVADRIVELLQRKGLYERDRTFKSRICISRIAADAGLRHPLQAR